MIALSEKKKMTQVLLFLVMNLMELFVSELCVYTTSIKPRSKKEKNHNCETHIRKPYLTGGGGRRGVGGGVGWGGIPKKQILTANPGVSQARISNALSVMEESKANEKQNTKIFIQGKKKFKNQSPLW